MNLGNTFKPSVKTKEERPIRTEFKHMASFKIHKGQQCFKMNIKTGEVSLAKIESVTSDVKGKVSRKVLYEDGYVYTSAINSANAERKLVLQLFKIFSIHQENKKALPKQGLSL